MEDEWGKTNRGQLRTTVRFACLEDLMTVNVFRVRATKQKPPARADGLF
jgi:hypothetical protein